MGRIKKLFEKNFRNPYFIGAGCAFNIAGNYYSYDFKKAGREPITKSTKDHWQEVAKQLKIEMRKNLIEHVEREYAT